MHCMKFEAELKIKKNKVKNVYAISKSVGHQFASWTAVSSGQRLRGSSLSSAASALRGAEATPCCDQAASHRVKTNKSAFSSGS